MMARNGNAFEDLLVLDLTRYMPGGFATQILADWGATVIKVEDTKRGDFCRYDPPTKHGISYYSTALCRNKKSISLDLKNKEANDCFQELSKKADIIIESFRPGVTKKARNRLRIHPPEKPRCYLCFDKCLRTRRPTLSKSLA